MRLSDLGSIHIVDLTCLKPKSVWLNFKSVYMLYQLKTYKNELA